MFVVKVVSVSPALEGEVYKYPNDVSDYFIGLYVFEVGEVCHVVELDEESYDVEGVDGPA